MERFRGRALRSEMLDFMRAQRFAVQASASRAGGVQAAMVGIAVTERFEIVFDSIDSTRKVGNLSAKPMIAFVIGGWDSPEEVTLQYEGLVDRPSGAELERLKALYFANFPEGRARSAWPGIVYLRARPTWIRYSVLGGTPHTIVELDAEGIASLG